MDDPLWDKQEETNEASSSSKESAESLLARAGKMKLVEVQDLLKERDISTNKKMWKNKGKMSQLLKDVLEQEIMSEQMEEQKKSSMKFPPFDGLIDGEPLDTLKVADLKLELKKRGYKSGKKPHDELVALLHKVMEEAYNQSMMQQHHEPTFQEWRQQANENKPHFFSNYEIHRQLVLHARTGEYEKVKSLLDNTEAAVDINFQNPGMADSALIAAAYNGKARIVKLLLDRGASATLTNKKGETAIQAAALGEYREIVDMLKNRWRVKQPDLASMMDHSIPANYIGVPAYGTADQQLLIAQKERDERQLKILKQQKQRAKTKAKGVPSLLTSSSEPALRIAGNQEYAAEGGYYDN